MLEDRIRALTARRLIKPTSPRRPSAWQPNLGKRSTYRRGKSVQTTGTTSLSGGRRICSDLFRVVRAARDGPGGLYPLDLLSKPRGADDTSNYASQDRCRRAPPLGGNDHRQGRET